MIALPQLLGLALLVHQESPSACLMAHASRASSVDDCRKSQTSAATPAEPGDLPWGLAPVAGRINLAIEVFDRLPGAEHGAFLPTGHEGRMVAGELETALRPRQHVGVLAIARIGLVGPAVPGKLHVAPADRDAMLDPF